MSWDRILQIDPGPTVPLRERINQLFAQQRATWPALRDGEAALTQLQRKTLRWGDDEIIVQMNPARRRSTQAKTDAQSIAARPCFLCPENTPAEERGVAFEDFVVMPNPFPILPMHCTIAHREHRPQEIRGEIGTLLRLAAAVGPDMCIFYNGPQCGASAPDHLHFRASVAAPIPILNQLPIVDFGRDATVFTTFGRVVLIFVNADPGALEQQLETAILAAGQPSGDATEPMFNLLVRYEHNRYVVLLFPRRAHRPTCYFREGSAHIGVSPAVLEMAGILVVTDAEHFDRLDAKAALEIYDEVSFPSAEVQLPSRA